MQNQLDSKFILAVFDKINQYGENDNGIRMLEGIKAYTDHDGYTVFLEDARVQLRFGFHNQYTFEYEQTEHLEQFEKKLHHIEKNY